MSKKMVVVEEVPEIEESKKEEISIVRSDSEPSSEFIEEKTNYLWIIIPTALLVGALVGGLITYFAGISKLNDSVATPSPVATIPSSEASATATPTPVTESKRSEIKLQILNGSGVSGLAGKAKTYLEGLGYKNVVAGNAPTSDFTETVISVKDGGDDFLETLKTDLSKNYKVAKETEILSASSKYDFVVTLGNK